MIAFRADALVQASSEQSKHAFIEGTKYKYIRNNIFNKNKLNKHKWVCPTGSILPSRRLPANQQIQ